MKKYEYGRIGILEENLQKFGVDPEIITQIMAGGQEVRTSTSGENKAAWMRAAMLQMDRLLDEDTRYQVREACACCLGGKRLQESKAIFKNNSTLEERVRAANETRFVFGHSVTLQEDGQVRVQFAPEGLERYGCPCLPKAQEPMPITYCYCCGGHVKHHLQTALGEKLAVRVLVTALSSGGKRPCTFEFKLC